MMADTLSRERRSWNMSRIRGADTQPELALRSLLHRKGFRFRLHKNSLPGKPDIVLAKYGTVIFVHGCFWHRHENCKNTTTPSTRPEFWRAKFEGNVRRDAMNEKRLRAEGWRVLTVWECDIERNPEKVAKTVSGYLRRSG